MTAAAGGARAMRRPQVQAAGGYGATYHLLRRQWLEAILAWGSCWRGTTRAMRPPEHGRAGRGCMRVGLELAAGEAGLGTTGGGRGYTRALPQRQFGAPHCI
jgi:hypothetical protein